MALAPPAPHLVSAATYERALPVSLDRVWENVLDWEHLPWLHARTFGEIELREAGDWGWRARLAGAGADVASLVELEIDRDALHYVARTRPEAPEAHEAGTAAAITSEIWTTLARGGADRTHVHVDFRVPGLPADALAAVGRVYVELYTALWDEDEEMMCERAERLRELEAAEPAVAVELGPVDALRARLPLDVRFAGRPCRVALMGGELVAYSAVCPHLLGPLFEADGDPATLECPWHGYRFDAATGRSCDGHGLKLAPAPRVVVDPATGTCRLEPR